MIFGRQFDSMITDRSNSIFLLWLSVLYVIDVNFGKSANMYVQIISGLVEVAETPPLREMLLTRSTLCSLCIMSL